MFRMIVMALAVATGLGSIAPAKDGPTRYGKFCGYQSQHFSERAHKSPRDKFDKICRAHDACCELGGWKMFAGMMQCANICNRALKWNLKKYQQKKCAVTKTVSDLVTKGKFDGDNAKVCAWYHGTGSVYTLFGAKNGAGADWFNDLVGGKPNPSKSEKRLLDRMKTEYRRPIKWPYGPG